MSTESRETRRREAPAGVKSYKINGVQRVSPTWRKRSKSTSHDNALYRMGVRKNAQEEWADVINRVPLAMINAMRKLRLNSIKREPTTDVDESTGLPVSVVEDIDMIREVEVMEVVGGNDWDMADPAHVAETGHPGGNDLDMPDFEDPHDEEDDNDGNEGPIDMTDSTAVYGRIRISLDVDREVAGGHVYVDENGTKAEIVMTSVEANVMDMVEEKEVSKSGEVERTNAPCESMTSIAEEDEESLNLDPTNDRERQQSSTDSTGEEANQPTKKKGTTRWTDEEVLYVGALADAGFTRVTSIEPFRERFPDRETITPKSIDSLRRKCSSKTLYLQQSQLLGLELGLVTGKWTGMKKGLLMHTQTNDQQALMAQHKLELDEGNKALLGCCYAGARLNAHSTMRQMFVAQRAQARDLCRQQSGKLRYFPSRDAEYKNYLAQLTILIHRTETEAVTFPVVTVAYSLPIEVQQRLDENIIATAGGYGLSVQQYEYEAAITLLEEHHGIVADLDYQQDAMDILDFDDKPFYGKLADHYRLYQKQLVEDRRRTRQSRRMLHIQEGERRRLFEEKQKEALVSGAAMNETKPLEASEVIVRLIWPVEVELIDALLSSEEDEKARIEAGLRAIEPDSKWMAKRDALDRVLLEHRATMMDIRRIVHSYP